jgi:hypothetical protein
MPPEDDRPAKPKFRPVRNPLGVIGSFLTLVYAMAIGALALLTRGLDPNYQWALGAVVAFIVTCPFFILGILTWLIVRHTDKLYSPSEYGDWKPSWMKQEQQLPLDKPKKKPLRTSGAKLRRKPTRPDAPPPQEPTP